jgi:peroxiredoxin
MPSFQTQIHDVYPQEEVQVLALNQNADRTWLTAYAADTIYIKDTVITYPLLFDSLGTAFESYQTSTSLLPSIFLVDQAGKIRLRYDIANDPETFDDHLNEIIATIDELLED